MHILRPEKNKTLHFLYFEGISSQGIYVQFSPEQGKPGSNFIQISPKEVQHVTAPYQYCAQKKGGKPGENDSWGINKKKSPRTC